LGLEVIGWPNRTHTHTHTHKHTHTHTQSTRHCHTPHIITHTVLHTQLLFTSHARHTGARLLQCLPITEPQPGMEVGDSATKARGIYVNIYQQV